MLGFLIVSVLASGRCRQKDDLRMPQALQLPRGENHDDSRAFLGRTSRARVPRYHAVRKIEFICQVRSKIL
jgi:hypothetical protein